jgi:GNAT superfamily N-acetyltransferase
MRIARRSIEESGMRAFLTEDLKAVKDLIHRTIDACYPVAYPPNAIAFFKDYHSAERILKDADRGYAVVVEEDGCVVATGTIVEMHIKRVFVAPAVQGLAYGRALMTHLEEYARDEGVDMVDLNASLVSKAFYEALGYEVSEEASTDVGDGQTLDFWRMRKALSPGWRP